jgi:hypothetical protein
MKRLWLSLLTGTAVSIVGLTSCSPIQTSADMAESAPSADTTLNQSSADITASKAASAESSPSETFAEAPISAPAQMPQLIKRANLSLTVDSVDDSFSQIREIVKAQQGDILSLQDEGHSSQTRLRRVTFELRVPQAKLEPTLDALTQLGTVVNRSLSTEDVSTQLVDLEARLSNARKSEEALRELMDRSGAITDVLQVSRELSTVRERIEQMAAQQKSLQTQVSYSTISLSVESAIATSPDQPAVSSQLGNAWKAATYSVGNATTGLLKLSLWLLAYSPYLAVLVGGAFLARRVNRRLARSRS